MNNKEVAFVEFKNKLKNKSSIDSEFKKVLRQLKTDQAKEMYDNIIIDTVDIAYGLCEKFIVNQHVASDIADQKK